MSISDKINAALDKALYEAIEEKNSGKILTILTDEILKLTAKKLSVKEQCEIINRAFEINIKEGTYRSFFYRKIKPLMNTKNNDFVEKSSIKKTVVPTSPTPIKEDKEEETTTPTKEDKVAPIEPTNSLVKNLNKDFVRKTKPKFNKEDF